MIKMANSVNECSKAATWIILILTAVMVPVVNPEAFSSIANMMQLVDNEDALLEQVDMYIQKEEQRIAELKSLVQHMRNQTERYNKGIEAADEEPLRRVEHPITAFSLMRNWARLSDLCSSTTTASYQEVQNFAANQGLHLPGSNDYSGAIAALIRLQKTYKLPVDDLAKGEVFGFKSLEPLSPYDFYSLGKMSLEVDHNLSQAWFEKALQALNQDGISSVEGEALTSDQNNNDVTQAKNIHLSKDVEAVPISDLFYQLASLYVENNDYEQGIKMGRASLQLDPTSQGLDANVRRWEEHYKKTGNNTMTTDTLWKKYMGPDRDYYEVLCRGEQLHNDILVNPSLICQYKAGKIPYLRYKEEIHSFDPRISLFVDVITDEESERIAQLAYPQLYRAQVGDPSKAFTSDERVSKLAWLWDTDAFVKKMSDRVADITGLSTTYSYRYSHSESFQVVNYGMGGQYEPHYDYYDNKEMLNKLPDFIMGTGDRIATFLFYLSEIAAGGATVYPKVGVRVPPIKNSAAFWYNLKRSGEFDMNTLHAGCPVLLGQKWIANKWIREVPQTFNRPCGMDYYARDPL